MKLLSILSFIALFSFACKDSSKIRWTKATYIMDKPVLVNLNLGDTAQSHGDLTAYEGVLKDTAGKIVGEVLGINTVIDLMDGDSLQPVHNIERSGMLVFNFGDENEIVVDGANSAHKGQQKMKMGMPQSKAIVGGTGIYKGIKGVMTSTPEQDSTYTVVFDIKNTQ